MQKQSDTDTEQPADGQKKIELSGAQVAGSAAATVVTAFLASSMGVYGTIIGAGVVSVGATAGGAVFQHVFRRTGEQIKEAAVHGPKATKVAKALPVLNKTRETAAVTDATRPLNATQMMPQADATALLTADAPGAGGSPPGAGDPPPGGPPSDAGYGDATVHGSAKRGMRWKRIALTAAGVFAIGIGAITAVEAVAGESMSDVWGRGNGGGTSVGSIFGGGGGGTSTDDSEHQQQDQQKDEDGKQDKKSGGGDTDPTPGTGDDGATNTSPGASEGGQGGQGGGQKPDPGKTPDTGGDSGQGDGGKQSPAPTPKPSTSDGGGASPEGGSAGADAQLPKSESSAG